MGHKKIVVVRDDVVSNREVHVAYKKNVTWFAEDEDDTICIEFTDGVPLEWGPDRKRSAKGSVGGKVKDKIELKKYPYAPTTTAKLTSAPHGLNEPELIVDGGPITQLSKKTANKAKAAANAKKGKKVAKKR